MDNSYTNASPNAPWRSTFYLEAPWSADAVSEFTNLTGFNLQMITIDLLHSWHLGVGRDLCGGAIQQLAKSRGFWPGRTQVDRLASATARLKSFCKRQKLILSLRRFTKANLQWKSDCYPEVRCKGFDTYIILSWLTEEVTQQDCGDHTLATASWHQSVPSL